MPPHPWEWRLYDPRTGRDKLFLKLRAFPVHLRWNPSFTYAEFIDGNRIMRVDWRMGATPREIVSLPTDSSWCDFWQDSSGTWHLFNLQEITYPWRDGSVMSGYVGTRWDLPPRSSWGIAVIDSEVDGYYQCLPTERLLESAPRPIMETAQSLVNSMSLGSHRDSIVQDAPIHDGAEAQVWVASDMDPLVGLEMGAASGDSYHAFEPVMWKDRRSGRRELVYEMGQSRDDVFGQIAFAERDGYALIVSEFNGAHPAVVDLRRGKVLLRVDRKSSQAVWVPAPR